jgi:leucyl-tRNA synthetase
MGPLKDEKPWSSAGLQAARKFIERVIRLVCNETNCQVVEHDTPNLTKSYHKTVKKVTNDFEGMSFNTAIAQMMIFVNDCYKEKEVSKTYIEGLVKMLSPIAPHICEELWETLGHNETLAYEAWPTYQEALCVDNVVTIVIQVNGKIRDKIEASADATKEELEKLALESVKVQELLNGATPKKIIVVPKKLVSIVL